MESEMNTGFSPGTGSSVREPSPPGNGTIEQESREPPRLFRRIRRGARRSLTSRWGKTAAGFLFLCGIVVLCFLLRGLILETLGMGGKMISFASGVLTIRLPLVVINGALVLVILLLLSPLGLGYLRLIYQMTAGEEPFLSVIFDPLRSFRMTLRSIWATLLMLLMDAVSLMVCCLPGLTAMFAARVLPGRTGKAAVCRIALLLLGVALLLVGVLLAAVWTSRFFAVGFLLADENLGVIGAFRLSFQISRGFTGEIIMLMVSFIPAGVLCILLVPAVFVVPYVTASFALLARVLLDHSRMQAQVSEDGQSAEN